MVYRFNTSALYNVLKKVRILKVIVKPTKLKQTWRKAIVFFFFQNTQSIRSISMFLV